MDLSLSFSFIFWKRIFILSLFVLGLPLMVSNSTAGVFHEAGAGVGMAMISFSEQETSLEGENVSEPASGSYSSIATNLYYKFFHRPKYSIYATGAFPLLGNADTSFLSAGMGIEYYFSDENQRVSERGNNMKIYIDPKIRYYAIGEVNALYISYITEEAKKNDVAAELALGAGLSYSLGGDWKDWGLRASGVVGRGLGVVTTSFNMKAFASAIYYFEP